MKYFNNLKVSHKFLTVGAILLPLMILMSGTGVWGTVQLNNNLQDVRHNQIPTVYQVAGIIQQTKTVQLELAEILIELNPYKANLQADKIPNLMVAARNNLAQAQKAWDAYLALPAQPDEAALIEQFGNSWKIWTSEANGILNLIDQKAANLEEISLSIFQELSTQDDNLETILLSLANLNYQSAIVKADNGINTSQTVTLIIIITALLMVLLNLGAGLLLSRSISSALKSLKNATQAIASGDLTQQVKVLTHDEIGELGTTFNFTLISLKQLVSQLHFQSQQVSSATQELTSQAQSQVSGSSQQASTIAEATQSLQELKRAADDIMIQALNVNRVVERSVIQAQTVSILSEEMAVAQQQGRQTVAETIESIQKLKEQVAAIESGQQNLVAQSSEIRKVIEFIESIAQETHLLALNAAIEAAGAGEYAGRFSVVAQHIKQLADRSVKATNEVRTGLGGITQLVLEVSQRAKKGLNEAEQAVIEANKSDATLLALSQLSEKVRLAAYDIMDQVMGSASLANNIGVSTQQQQTASSKMLDRMLEIETIMAQNLSSVRQGEAATYQLSLTAKELLQSANAFKLVAA